ncbi:MAG TPA: lycopene cyclase domain-containing protein [Candidatus Paceibacterota bacterium]|jgi:hypothetical protein|nr:lycopene cyclase domain-containing protein [Candidatus Paceibacterota bacterium]
MIPSYAYLIGDSILLFVWLVLFALRKDLRVQMIAMSLIVAPMGPLSELFYLRDYWDPRLIGGFRLGFEDLLFAFAIGGIAAVIYEEIFMRREKRAKVSRPRHWIMGSACFALAWMLLGVFAFHINSIYVSISDLLAIGIAMLAVRRDLIGDAVLSGLSVCVLLFVFDFTFLHLFPGVIQAWWQLRNLSGVLIAGVPLEELMWGFGWGFVAGPSYEFLLGLKPQPIKKWRGS